MFKSENENRRKTDRGLRGKGSSLVTTNGTPRKPLTNIHTRTYSHTRVRMYLRMYVCPPNEK